MKRPRRGRRRSNRPWQARDPAGLREAIYAAVSLTTVRTFGQIYAQVLDDYGSCARRTVHRHLVWLRDRERIVRLEFPGVALSAYLRAGSKLVADADFVREQLLAALPSSQIKRSY